MYQYVFNKSVNAERLEKEIRESAIVTALDSISVLANEVSIVFKANLSLGDEAMLQQIIEQHVNEPLSYPSEALKLDVPLDPTGRPIFRQAATISGWHYQILSMEITTATVDGVYCKDYAGNDIGFASIKLFDANGDETQIEQDAVRTDVILRPTHDYEVIGAIFAQDDSPLSNIRMWVTGLPGVANVKFTTGGINLKHIGKGTIQLADGRASKYLAYNAQMPDLNSFKFTLAHGAGVQHDFQVMLELFKAP